MNVDYQVVKSKRKSLALQVKLDGSVIVRTPLKTSKAEIVAFVNKYKNWIQEKLTKISTIATTTDRRYYYLGNPYLLKTDIATNGIIFKDGILITNLLQDQIILWYYTQAKQLVQPFMEKYSQKFKLKYAAVKISNARKIWGSCSSRGNISFSYRIAMLPIDVIEYIVTHELGHLKHHNHSPEFWAYVEQLYPEYKKAEQWLKQNRHSLAQSMI